jgi:hypothetical protein
MGKKGGKFKKKQTMRSKFAENAAEIEVNDERYKASAAERWERRKDLDGSGDESGEEGEEGKEGGKGGGVLGAAAGMGGMTMESESVRPHLARGVDEGCCCCCSRRVMDVACVV